MYQLKDFGSYMAGGRVHVVSDQPVETIHFTPTTPYQYDPNGHHLIEHCYVQYFVPQNRNSEPPIVLVHGGGMTGTMWETTPDARPGWLHLLLQRGFEVHVVDNVERGRAGWHPGIWPGDPVVRTMEEAWSLFRIGRQEDFERRTPFPGQQFPVGHLDELCRHFVPRWTSTLQCQAAALAEVLAKLGSAHIICHSQGAQVVFSAAEQAAQHIHQITAIEPSGLPAGEANLLDAPILFVFGDFTDTTAVWQGLVGRCENFAQSAGPRMSWLDLSAVGLPGHSHMMMMDNGNDRVLSQVLENL